MNESYVWDGDTATAITISRRLGQFGIKVWVFGDGTLAGRRGDELSPWIQVGEHLTITDGVLFLGGAKLELGREELKAVGELQFSDIRSAKTWGRGIREGRYLAEWLYDRGCAVEMSDDILWFYPKVRVNGIEYEFTDILLELADGRDVFVTRNEYMQILGITDFNRLRLHLENLNR